MKTYINGFLIVEGIHDKAFLSSFIDCEIIYMGGYNVPRGTIEYILQLSQVLQPIILCDPDDAGRIIDKRLQKIIPNAKSVLINKNPLNINKKDGVAESSKQEILNALSEFITNKKPKTGNIKVSDLYSLGINNKAILNVVASKFKLGDCNLKTLVKRLNSLNIKLIEIKNTVETIKNYGNK